MKPAKKHLMKPANKRNFFSLFFFPVIQFGFVTIFVAAFPLAPFFALANNIFEIRIDSDKMVCDLRRPVAHRAQDIGIWFSMLSAIAKMAVISNVSTVAMVVVDQ